MNSTKLMRMALFVLVSMLSRAAMAVTPEIVTVPGKNGVKFRHFEFRLAQGNVLLPRDVPSRRGRLDEKSENFSHGQFEIFIPATMLELNTGCKGNYIVRMPQTIDLKSTEEIKKKQALFSEIQRVAQGRQDPVSVVIELSPKRGCNLFFRSGKSGEYLNYVGPARS